MIDDQVHLREPGMEYKADMATESTAAAAGGVTSFMDMPTTSPPTLSADALAHKYRLAAGRARANDGLYMAASNDNLQASRRADPPAAPGIPAFLGAPTGTMLDDTPETPRGVYREPPTPNI